jgi:glycosyltransferase involved in cell wall biosynthesis
VLTGPAGTLTYAVSLATDINVQQSAEGPPLLLVSINPDLASDAGHYLYLDRELAREAEARGWGFESWGNKVLPTRLLGAHEWLRPVFSDSGTLSMHHEAEQRERFFQALLEGCCSALGWDSARNVILFLYTGHPCQMVACWRLLQSIADPRLRIVFNLYAAHWEFDEERLRYRYMADTLRRTLVPGAALVDRQRFVLTSDSGTIAAVAERSWWATVPVLPFFSIVSASPALPIENGRKPVTVAYPSSVHRHRGFTAFPEMVRYCQAETGKEVHFIFRTCLEETALAEDEESLCLQLRQLGCEVRHGSFSAEEMDRFFAEADVILSPYPVSHFKDRTSANVADALAFGKPIIAARDTWAGRLIERLECGETFTDGNGHCMAQALLRVVKDLPRYTRQAQTQGALWKQENNLPALVSFLVRVTETPPPALPRTETADWKEAVLALLDSSANESSHAAEPRYVPQASPGISPHRLIRMKERIAELQEQKLEMRRAIEHYRASPVRALRLWLNRKLRRLTLED